MAQSQPSDASIKKSSIDSLSGMKADSAPIKGRVFSQKAMRKIAGRSDELPFGLPGQTFLDRSGYFVNRCLFRKLLDVLTGADFSQSELEGDVTVDSDHGRDLLFRKQKDLQHQVFAFIRAPAQPCLPHEDEAREQDAFERETAVHEGIWKGIKMRDGKDMRGIDKDPRGYE
jgi:hypothetical protein